MKKQDLKTIKLKGRDIEGYFLDNEGNLYSQWVKGSRSDLGQKRKGETKRLKGMKHKNGYVSFNFRGQFGNRYIHELMLETFKGERPAGLYGLHKNDNKTDNRLGNLYWGTPKENMADAKKNGRRNDCRGVDKPFCKLSEEAVVEIYKTPKKRGYLVGLREKFGVSFQTIYDIRKGVYWKHITNNL